MNNGHAVYVTWYQIYLGSFYESRLNPFAQFHMQSRVQVHTCKDRRWCLSGKHAAFSSAASRQGTLSLFKATRLHISAARACWAVSNPEAHTLIVKRGGERQASYQALFSASGLCLSLDRCHLMPSEAKNKTRPCSSGPITKQGHNQHEIRLFQERLAFFLTSCGT